MEVIKFFAEVFGIIVLGASYSIFLESENWGRFAVCIGIVLLLISKIEKNKKEVQTNAKKNN